MTSPLALLAGQSSYSFANNAASQVCRARRTAGLPGISLGWGPIGNVGFVADSEIVSPQNPSSWSHKCPVPCTTPTCEGHVMFNEGTHDHDGIAWLT